jgi:hypothetical protein
MIQKLNDKTEQLKAELLKNQFILNNSAGYYELDAQGFYMSMNNRLLNSIVMQFSELDNRDIRSFMTTDEEINVFNEGLKKLADGLIHSALTRYSFNGKTVFLNETFTPIRDEYNVLLKICVISKNVTKPMEYNISLERQVAELTAEKDLLEKRLELEG